VDLLILAGDRPAPGVAGSTVAGVEEDSPGCRGFGVPSFATVSGAPAAGQTAGSARADGARRTRAAIRR
jgi:hypothetical protein